VDETDGLPQPNPKADGIEVQFDGTVPALEDKIVQRAVVALLNAIYEEDFLGISYGFRPGRGTHFVRQGHTAAITAGAFG
jgi:retron-type reverse transcriptase